MSKTKFKIYKMKKHLLVIILITQSIFINAQVPTLERDALMALYNATDGPNWTFPGQWGSTTIPVADWYGVSVENISGQDHVTVIALGVNNLIGSIPPEIGNFSHLETLSLAGNQLTGNIPIEIGNLTNLNMLLLDGCLLSGNIPIEIGNLSNLFELTFMGNQLTGDIPSEIGSLLNLAGLDLSYNQLSGTVPTEIENLNNIQGINLRNNELSGELDLSNLPNLAALLLSNNSFTQLDIRNENNTNFTMFDITNNPNLICVFVDDTSWSETNWLDKDETAQYFETQAECDTYLSVDKNITVSSIYLFPNPTTGVLHIKHEENTLLKQIKVYSVLGKLIKIFNNTNSLDVKNLSQGIYYLKIYDDTSNQFVYKFIKK